VKRGSPRLEPPRRRPGLAAGLALAASLALLPGCLILPAFASARTGSLLPDDRLAALKPGMSRLELLDGFGSPLAVVRRGSGPVRVPGVSLRLAGVEEIPAELFFGRFADQPAGPGDVVYFYRAHQLTTVGSGVAVMVFNAGGLAGSSRDEHREDRLWVLLDGAAGLVRAHVLERDVPPPPVEPPAPEAASAILGAGGPP
jgi:hypothetical protein